MTLRPGTYLHGAGVCRLGAELSGRRNPLIVAALTVLCLNRVILMGVAWIVGGATANLSELAVHGAVVDFIPRSWPSERVMSLGDVCLSVGLVLLGVGAVLVVTSGLAADRARGRQRH